MPNGLASELLKRLDKQIADKQSDDDSEWIMLYVLREIYTNVLKHNENPAVQFGEFCKEHPKIAWITFMVVWVITGASVMLALGEVLKMVGVI